MNNVFFIRMAFNNYICNATFCTKQINFCLLLVNKASFGELSRKGTISGAIAIKRRSLVHTF